MRRLSVCVLAMWAFAFATQGQARDLKVATFNIEWYGTGGTMRGTPEDETRDYDLRRFIKRELGDVDVIVFQEIVDVDRFVANVIDRDDRWCVSYDRDWYPHQHVVICGTHDYTFQRDPYDNNFQLEDVAINPTKSRPALHGILHTRWGEPIVHLVGVHLKAYPDESPIRVGQMEVIAEYLAERRDEVPTIVVGDMNSYPSPDNEQRYDDVRLFEDVFRRAGVRMRWVPNDGLKTYREGDWSNELDHFFTSRNIWQTRDLDVIGPCNYASDYEVRRYNDEISDHCPVVVEFSL